MFGGVIALVIVFFIVFGIAGALKTAGMSYDAIIAKGVHARGIPLSVALRGTRIGTVNKRYQVRQVTIDIEIPGEAPYVMTGVAIIPMNLVRDVLPGATLEIAVDKTKPDRVAIVGPGAGFSPIAMLTRGAT